jgi:hypothetical protein
MPASLRPERRVPLLLILVEKCHGSGASWKSLQLLNWVVRNSEHAKVITALRGGSDVPDKPLVRFEPALDRAIDLAVGLGFLEVKAGRVFKLTAVGRSLLREVHESNAFRFESSVLREISGKVTQKEVVRILEWRYQ